tara:strand:+ start:466 stop:981 length:516 start_codon:yes stop_codon:yes gene_type:complete
MPTLKAEFSGGAGGAGGDDGNNQEHTVILFNISYVADKHNRDFLAHLKKSIIEKLSQQAKGVEEEEKEEEEKGGGGADEAQEEGEKGAEGGEEKGEKEEEKSNYETFLKNEIGYCISVVYEPPIPTNRSFTSKTPQYIGITLNLTYLESKTNKEAKEIFEICRNEYFHPKK